jgi:hypothetical protein
MGRMRYVCPGLFSLFFFFLVCQAALPADVILVWDSNTETDLAGYKLYYGTVSGTYVSQIDVGKATTYTVSNLGSGTYYFALTALNGAGAESGFSNEVSINLATLAPVISSIAANVITSNSASISWATDKASDSQIDYGTTPGYGSSVVLNTSLVTSHSQTINGLSTGTLYHYRVKSKDAAGNAAVSGDFTFTTLVSSDTTPPVISGVTASGISASGATINWSTNEASDGQVEYGSTTSYGTLTAVNASLATVHSETLTGLNASTVYHYRVRSKDAGGNAAVSGDFQFTTTAKPIQTLTISGVGIFSIKSTSATINWTTNLPSNSQVEYGTTNSYGSYTTLNSAQVTSHGVVISGLRQYTLYYFRVVSKASGGTAVKSSGYQFRTRFW